MGGASRMVARARLGCMVMMIFVVMVLVIDREVLRVRVQGQKVIVISKKVVGREGVRRGLCR